MHVEESAGPMTVQARVLAAPTLRYHGESRQPTIVSPLVGYAASALLTMHSLSNLETGSGTCE